jgi:hypothetical protein
MGICGQRHTTAGLPPRKRAPVPILRTGSSVGPRAGTDGSGEEENLFRAPSRKLARANSVSHLRFISVSRVFIRDLVQHPLQRPFLLLRSWRRKIPLFVFQQKNDKFFYLSESHMKLHFN